MKEIFKGFDPYLLIEKIFISEEYIFINKKYFLMCEILNILDHLGFYS